MQIELSSTPDLTLTRALLIYSSSRGDVAVTDHNVVGNQIQPGRPLDFDAFREYLAGGTGAGSPQQDGFTYTHPHMIAESRGFRVWWTPACARHLFIKGKPTNCWLPPLIWCAGKSKNTLFVWGFQARGNGLQGAPWGETLVHHPKLSHHVHPDGNVCLGNMNPGDRQPASWEAAFYDTAFTDSIPSKHYAIETRPSLGTLKARLAIVSRLEAGGRQRD